MVEEEVAVVNESNAQAYMEGLSRLDRVVDDSGFAFSALDIVGKELTSLEPIKNYPHLRFVNLTQNQIADVTSLAELPYLICANLSENAIAAPFALPQAYLQAVDVSLNQIPTLQGFQSTSLSSLKISGKWCCTTFQWFKVGANTQGSLSPDNVLENLAGLSGLPSLLVLEASRNNIEDLSSLSIESAGSKLERLELQENKLTSLNGIESLPALSSLAVQHNLIASLQALAPLSQLRALRDLELSGNPVTETDDYRLQLLLQLPSLTRLDGVIITESERLAAADLKQQQCDAAQSHDDQPDDA